MHRPNLTVCLCALACACLAFEASHLLAQSAARYGQTRQQAHRRPVSKVHRASADFVAAYSPAGDSQPGRHPEMLEPIPLEAIDLHNASIGCDGCGAGIAAECCCYPFGYLLDWRRSDLSFGFVGFTGAGDFITSGTETEGQVEGNFGFQEAFNFGSRLPSLLGGQVGSQIGLRLTQSQLDGTAAGEDSRTQAFVTAGLFRRVDYGLQGGLVIDYLHDDWVYQADLLQLRGELSFLLTPCHDLGFRFTDSQQTDDVTASLRSGSQQTLQLASLNTYRFFYRFRFGECAGGLGELRAGFTEDSGGILGLGVKTPLQGQLGLDLNATYAIPPSSADMAYNQAGWNISLAFVWTPGRMFGQQRDYYRPLFDVADNGSLLTRRVP
jgi:hypothetical protein